MKRMKILTGTLMMMSFVSVLAQISITEPYKAGNQKYDRDTVSYQQGATVVFKGTYDLANADSTEVKVMVLDKNDGWKSMDAYAVKADGSLLTGKPLDGIFEDTLTIPADFTPLSAIDASVNPLYLFQARVHPKNDDKIFSNGVIKVIEAFADSVALNYEPESNLGYWRTGYSYPIKGIYGLLGIEKVIINLVHTNADGDVLASHTDVIYNETVGLKTGVIDHSLDVPSDFSRTADFPADHKFYVEVALKYADGIEKSVKGYVKVTDQDLTNLTKYYISSSQGDDGHLGLEDNPFKTLNKINGITLSPGDSVFFKRGDTFLGHFVPNGSGTKDNPIVFTAYGDGEKPVISGQVGAAGGGDYAEAIRIENCDNLVLDGLEIQNERLVSRDGVKDTDAFGISIHNSSNEVMRNFLFKNLKICNVYAAEPMLNKDDFDKIQVSGIRFTSAKNTVEGKEKNINGVEITDCYFTDLQRLGVQFKHSGGATGIGNDSINRNMNIHIHHNEFYYLGGTGVLPNGTYNCLIENNIFDHPGATTDSRMPGRGSSIWNFNAINTIMQYNTVISTRGYLDSYGIHIDKHNKNTFVQYNYMVDCIGGFVEILANNENAVYRFNVSVNSGWRYTNGISTWKAGSSTIYIYSDRWTEENQAGLMLSDGVYVYNNTVVMDSTFETTFNVDAKNMFIYNNIFSSTDGAKMGYLQTVVRDNDTPFNLRNNLYEGDVNPTWIEYDKNPIHGSSNFTGADEGKLAFDLTENSDAINKGIAITGPAVPGAGYGVFKNIPAYPTVDFYGNPIDLSTGTPNIGASNKKFGSPDAVKTVDRSDSDWFVYPDPDSSTLRIQTRLSSSDPVKISLLNMKGQNVQTVETRLFAGSWYKMNLGPDIINGIYVVRIEGIDISHSRKVLWHQ